LISYVVISREPFSVEECNVGSGAACGAIYLHQGFEKLLRDKVGAQAKTILTERRVNEALRYFENAIKRAFNPYEEACETEFEIPMAGAPDVPALGLEEGYLKLSRSVPVPHF
jgi:hypothetical protein